MLAQRHLAHLSSDDLTLDNLRHHVAWHYWGDLIEVYLRETQRCQTSLRAFSGFFQSDVRQILKRYQTVLSVFVQQLFSQQLAFFKRCLDNLEAANEIRTISHTEIFALEKVMLRLSQLQQVGQVSIQSAEWENVIARYQAFFDVRSQMIIAAPLYKKSTEILQKASVGQRLISPEQELFSDVNVAASTAVPIASKVSSPVPTLDVKDNVSINPLYELGLFTINRRVTRQDVWHLFQQELMQSPLTFSSEKLKAHIAKLKQQTELLAMLNPALLLSSELQTAWYGYVHRLLISIQQLSGHSAFIPLEEQLECLLKTLLTLTPDAVLQHEITQLKQSMQSLKSLNWDLLVQIAITPRVAAFEKILSTNHSESTISSESPTKTLLK